MTTIGDLVVDILLEASLPARAEQHQMARRLQFEAGGACTTILAARRMGLAVAALGAIGDDLQGRLLLDILNRAGVDTAAISTPAESTTTTVLALTDSQRGGHVFLGHYGTGAPIEFSPAAAARLEAADALFIPGYSLLDARISPLVAGLFDWLATHKRRLYFDVGPYARQLTQPQMDQVLARSAVLLLTEDEIPFIAAGTRDLAACRARYPELTIVLKRGAAGCRIISRAVDLLCPGFAVDVVDTVGAGDAFAGAYIWADLNGYSAPECGTIANAMGAASVTKSGAGRQVPSCAEVQTLLRQAHTGINISC